MLSCEEALEQMSQALDSPLTGEEQGELEAHLACCPACRADWAALRELHQAMGELEETPVPEGFADRVMECCGGPRSRPVVRGVRRLRRGPSGRRGLCGRYR